MAVKETELQSQEKVFGLLPNNIKFLKFISATYIRVIGKNESLPFL